MDERRENRLPPEIILVPPPAGTGMPTRRIINIVGASAIGSAICLGLILARGWSFLQFLAIMAPIILVVAIVVLISYVFQDRGYQKLRRKFLEKHAIDETDVLIVALQRAWKEHDRVPKLEDVQTALNKEGRVISRDRALIVCYGEPDLPKIGELHFEPEIIAPTEAIWRQLIWPAIAGALLTWLLLDQLGVLPSWLPPARSLLGGFAYFLLAGAVTLAIWMWRGMIRPTYVRMAPGVIQFLEYRSSKSKPVIRSYPMETGTLAYLTKIRSKLFLTLARGSSKDTLVFSRMRKSRQWIERTWRALLSTAATPPLSEDELVG
jgi:hypothetical protein